VRFSAHFGISDLSDEDDWFDIELTTDTPLYVDPLLVFDDDDPTWSSTRTTVLDYFALAMEYVRLADGDQHSRHWQKAERMLTFPEPREFALGVTLGSPEGAGTGPQLARAMADSLDLLHQRRVETVRYVELFALFCEGLGVDRISDIFCNIAKKQFIDYTAQIVARHGVATHLIQVRHGDWSRSTGRWNDPKVRLPLNPAMRRDVAVLLCPDRFLKDIPRVTPEGLWTWAESNEAQVLRADLNYEIGKDLTTAERRAQGRKLARSSPDLAVKYIDVQAADGSKPYDIATDPKLLVGWAEAGRAAAAQYGPASPQPATEEAFLDWVGDLMREFKHAVEETGLWRTLWDDHLRTHRSEKIVQAVAGAMWAVRCRAADVDISGEANIGRGPVDFKFSAGWSRRALTEIKLIGSSHFFSGAEKQLPQYLRSERIVGGYYLCVGFVDTDFDDDRLKKVRDTCTALSAERDFEIRPIFVDARPGTKGSASTL
jgi:hypothetical protein